jgi:phosphate transport system protein
MTHSSLDREIKLARAEILFLGSMVEQAMLQSLIALRDHDMECSKTLLEYDYRINTERFSLEGAIIATMATQQPMAHDLRVLTAILDVCTELERIGDCAKGIAAIILRSGGLGLPNVLQDIHYMA